MKAIEESKNENHEQARNNEESNLEHMHPSVKQALQYIGQKSFNGGAANQRAPLQDVLENVEFAIYNLIANNKSKIEQPSKKKGKSDYTNGALALLFRLIIDNKIIQVSDTKLSLHLGIIAGKSGEEMRKALSKKMYGKNKFTQQDLEIIREFLTNALSQVENHTNKG